MRKQGKKNDQRKKNYYSVGDLTKLYQNEAKIYQDKNNVINSIAEKAKLKYTEQKCQLIDISPTTMREEVIDHDEHTLMRQQKDRDLQEKIIEYQSLLKQRQKDNYQLIQQNKVLKAKLTQKQNIIARNWHLYDSLLNKYHNQKMQINTKQQCISCLTKQLKKITQKMQAKDVYEEDYKTRKIETLQNIIKLNDEVAKESGDQNKQEIKVKDAVALVEGQKSELELLMLKIVEKEDYYQKFYLKNQQEYKRQEEERLAITQMRDKIESRETPQQPQSSKKIDLQKKQIKLKQQENQSLKQRAKCKAIGQKSEQGNKKRQWLLSSSDLLYKKDRIKEQIIKKIEKSGMKIARTRQIFKKDEYNHNFGNYLKETFYLPYLLLLVKVSNNKYMGAYTDEFREQGDIRKDEFTAFIFTSVDGQNVTFFDKTSPKPQTIKSAVYSDNSLIFGNRELLVKNSYREKQITWNASIFGKRYYQGHPGQKFLNQGSSRLKYEEMEMHVIEFSNTNTSRVSYK